MPDKNYQSNREGLIISHFGQSVIVENAAGEIVTCQLHRNQDQIVVGDRVLWSCGQSETGVIVDILPRKSLLYRGDGRDKTKPIAANIDLMLIVMAPPPIFSEYLIDRYLVASELVQIPAMIILNKIDLLDETGLTQMNQHLEPYQANYPVMRTCIYQHETLATLALQLKDKVGVLIGPSGVGKSSIISALSQHDIKTQAVNPKGGGKHTTTATRLYHLKDGGALIDSPGVREFNLWSVSEQDILRGFKEFEPYLGACKFRNCHHKVEPGCAIREAKAAGKINAKRYEIYCQLLENIGKR